MRQNNLTAWTYSEQLNSLFFSPKEWTGYSSITLQIDIINNSPYEDSISDALTGHKLAVQIMDEKLDKQKDEYITSPRKMLCVTLYYDFEK